MRAYASVAALALMAGSGAAASAEDPIAPPAAGAAPASVDDGAPYDPWEKINRAIWGVNMGVDKVVIKPASTVYRTVTPRPARRGLTRVLANLSEPYSVVNNLLQGKADRAFNSLGRFVINMTAGVGGLADQASRMGLKQTPEDLGQTLAHWGVKAGPYVVLPLLGPSTVRDGIGSGASFLIDPFRIGLRESGLSSTARLGENAFEVVSARSDLTDSGGDTFLKTSLDSYAAARSAFLQRRQQAILDQDDGGSMSAPAGASTTDDPSVKAALDELKTEQGATGAPSAPPADTTPPPAATPVAPETVPPPTTTPH